MSQENEPMTDTDLQQRVQRLEDIEAIKVLKSRYAAFCDDGYDPDGLAPLFTEDAVWDGGALGRFEGRDAIRKFFSGASRAVPFAIHHVTNPAIEVEGNRGTGFWYLWQPCVFAEGNQALWMAGPYRDRYRREDGRWLFERVEIKLRMLSPYEAGFASARLVEVPS